MDSAFGTPATAVRSATADFVWWDLQGTTGSRTSRSARAVDFHRERSKLPPPRSFASAHYELVQICSVHRAFLDSCYSAKPMAEPAKPRSSWKRHASLFSEIFSSSNDEEVRATVVGHILQQTSPVQSPTHSRSGSTQISLPVADPIHSTDSAEQDDTLWFETARNGVGWGQVVVLFYVALGVAGGFIFWSQNSFSFVDSIFMTVSAITGSSLSTVLLKDSSFGSLVVINVLAFISSPTWSDLLFIIIWSVAPSSLSSVYSCISRMSFLF
jgi:hypothetical protein